MSFSPKKFIFNLLFSGLFFILILLGETSIGIAILGLIGIIYLIYQTLFFDKAKRSQSNRVHTVAIVLFFLFYLGSFLSLFFTASVPLTINKWILMSISVLTLEFFYFSEKKELPVDLILYQLLIVGINVGILCSMFFLFPVLAKHLPAMNLLFATYGHNHASIIFLFCVPIAFYIAQKNTFKRVWLLPLLFLFLNLLISFARVDIVIGTIELGIFIFFQKQNRSLRSLWSWKTGAVGVLALILIGISLTKIKPWQLCVSSTIKHQICKDLNTEYRLEYWQEAVKGITEKPLTGWGGGTFSIISARKAKYPYYYAAYAHNEYLQLLSEYGMLLSLSFFLFLIYVLGIGLSIKRDFSKPMIYLVMSFVALLIDALFDYNWNFSAIWLLLIISSALILREQQEVPTFLRKLSHTFSSLRYLVFARMLFIFCMGVLILWTVLYGVSSVLWYVGQKEASVTAFPFVYWRVEDEIASTSHSHFLLGLYFNDPAVLNKYVEKKGITNEEKINVLRHLIVISQFDLSAKTDLLALEAEADRPDLYFETLKNIYSVYKGTSLLDLEESESIFSQAVADSIVFFPKHSSLSGQIYASLASLDYGLTASRPFKPFLQPWIHPSPDLKLALSAIEPTGLLSDYKLTLLPWLTSQIHQEIMNSNWNGALSDTKLVLQINPENTWTIWSGISEDSIAQMQADVQTSKLDHASEVAQFAFQAWQLVQSSSNVILPNQEKFAHELALLGNVYYEQGNMASAFQTYKLAYGVSTYFTAETQLPFDNVNYDHQKFTNFIVMIEKTQSGNSTVPLLQNYLFKRPLQVLANEQIDQDDKVNAEITLKLLSSNLSRDYYASAQLGNYYLSTNQIEKARSFFTECVTHFERPIDQTDCYDGKLKSEKPDQVAYDKYAFASSQIVEK